MSVPYFSMTYAAYRASKAASSPIREGVRSSRRSIRVTASASRLLWLTRVRVTNVERWVKKRRMCRQATSTRVSCSRAASSERSKVTRGSASRSRLASARWPSCTAWTSSISRSPSALSVRASAAATASSSSTATGRSTGPAEPTARATSSAATFWSSFSPRVRFSPRNDTSPETRTGRETRPAPAPCCTKSFLTRGATTLDARRAPATASTRTVPIQ
nr:hypothetical protein [Streptomyces sp. SP18BB07]